MTAGPLEPRDRPAANDAEDDLSIVPGLEAAPEGPPASDPTHDMAVDPAAPLDPSTQPASDRRPPPPGQGQTLTDMLGEGAQEGQRDNFQWAYGLIGVLAFLALVSWLFSSVVGR